MRVLYGIVGDMSASGGRLDAMQGVADTGGHDLGLNVTLAEEGGDVSDEADAVVANVVETPDEWADDGGASLCAEKGLVDGET